MFTEFYSKKFKAIDDGKVITISREELETLGCPIDMTQVTDKEMQEIADKLYLEEEQTMLEFAEPWLLEKTKAKYIEDYSDLEFEKYKKRAKELYYKN
jgi:hypothetical protein